MPALHRTPSVVGAVAGLLVGGVVHYWFSSPVLSVAVGLLYVAVGYYHVRYGGVETRVRGLPRGAQVAGFAGILGAALSLAESAREFGLDGPEPYLYVLVAAGYAYFFATLAVRRAD